MRFPTTTADADDRTLSALPAQLQQGGWGAPALVAVLWLLLSFSAFGIANKYAMNMPYMDEWQHIEVWTGAKPFTLAYLWEQQNDSRVPPRKFAMHVLLWLGGGNFRFVNFAVVAALSGLSLGIVLMLRRIRGHIALTDAVVPLVLLQGSMYINFIWADPGMIWGLVTAGALIATVLAVNGRYRSPAQALTIFACSLAATFGCIGGLPIGAAIAVWMIAAGLMTWHGGALPRRQSVLLASLGTLSLLSIALYFVDFKRGTPHINATMKTFLRGLVEFAACPLRPESADYWPFFGIVVIAIFALSIGLATARLWRDKDDRPAALAGLLFPLAFLGLASIASWGRSGFCPGACMVERYTLIAACLILVPYLAVAALPRSELAAMLGFASLLLCCAPLVHNATFAQKMAADRFALARHMIATIKRGSSTSEELAIRFHAGLYPSAPVVDRKLRMMASAGLGPFRTIDPRNRAWLVMTPEERFALARSGPLLDAMVRDDNWPPRESSANDLVIEEPDTGCAFQFEAIGSDPHFTTVPAKRNCMVAIDIAVPEDTILQLYFTSAGSNYSEHESLSTFVKKGRNLLAFVLPDRPLEGELRLDPGTALGVYRLHAFELHAIPPEGPTGR